MILRWPCVATLAARLSFRPEPSGLGYQLHKEHRDHPIDLSQGRAEAGGDLRIAVTEKAFALARTLH